MRHLLPTTVFLLATLTVAAAQPRERGPWGKPLAELPEHVKASDGKLTVFADYANAKFWEVPVYVVNRTAAAVTLSGEDGFLYLMQEYEAAPGVWVRARSHTYSWCGNSYHRTPLEPGRYVVSEGFLPAQGEAATVRYKFYGQKGIDVASNAARGRIDKAEVEKAAGDAMAVQTGSFEFVRRVALGETKLPAERRNTALSRLYWGGFDPRETERVLEALARDPDAKLAERAGHLLRSWRETGPPKD